MARQTDNYQLSRDRAQAFFLRYDQQRMEAFWQLDHDENFLYLRFLGNDYRICRKTGSVSLSDGREAGYDEVLSIFDLLCHESPAKQLSGSFAPVNSLRGRPAIGVTTDFHSEAATVFDQDHAALRRACLALGGTPVPLGDVGFSFPVFGPISVRLKFYGSDEDFPASLVLLWDENLLQYVYYETVFYIANHLIRAITEELARQITKEEST